MTSDQVTPFRVHGSDAAPARPLDLLDRLAAVSRVQREGAQMLPDRTLTTAEMDEICSRVDAWMQQHGISRSQVASRIEVGRALVSQVLSGTYRGDREKYVRKLGVLLEQPQAAAEIRTPQRIAPVRTSTVNDMEAIVEAARTIGTNAIIFGPSGCGKTTYAKGRAAERNTCLYVHLDDKGYSRTRLLRRINEELRLGSEGGYHGDKILARICGAIAGDRRVVFIDNAHVLDTDGLWVLHSLHDRTGAVIVCIGQPSLYDTLDRSRNDRGVGATLWRRFAIKLDLEDATKPCVDPIDPSRVYRPAREWLHTIEDVRKYLASRRMKLHPAAVEWLHKVVNCPSKGGFGILNVIVGLAQAAYPEREVLGLPEIMQAYRRVDSQKEQKFLSQMIAELRPAVAAG